jgi:hypothetical protein
MSEIYWFVGGSGDPSAVLQRAGVRAAWLDEVHRLDPGEPLNLIGLNAPWFAWDARSPADHKLLLLASSQLLAASRRLILLLQGDSCVLLGSPEAVGRYNLLPKARLLAHYESGSEPPLADWLAAVLTDQPDPEGEPPPAPGLIALAGDAPVASELPLPALEAAPLLAALNQLVMALQSGDPAGLLVSLPAAGPRLATRVERI